jgi:hypothetical protein
MAQVNRSTDCGNSPKNKMVEDIAIALDTRDIDFLSFILDSEAVWNHEGGTSTTSEAILDQVGAVAKPTSLTVDHVMSHGKVGAVNGTAKRERREHRFCHVIEFTSVKCNRVRRIESYGG